MKKILFLTTRNFESFGGIERYIENFIKHYQDNSYQITLMLPENGMQRITRNPKIDFFSYRLSPVSFRNFFRFLNPLFFVIGFKKELKDKLVNLRPDLILTREWEIVISIASLNKNIPIYFMPGSLLRMDLRFDKELIGSFLYRLSRAIQAGIRVFLESLAFQYSDKIIVFSKVFKQRIVNSYKISYKKIHIITMGINNSYVKNGMDIEQNLIFSASRLTRSKNIYLGLEVMKRLSNFKWIIAGDGIDRDYLENKIRELDLKNRVILLGQVVDLSDYYEKCDLFVHLSYYENFGQVLLEAMLHGKAPIVLKSSNPNIYTASDEIIQDGYNGFFVEKDPDRIAERIKQIASLDKRKISENCKEFVKRYSFENHLAELFRLINEAL